MHGTTRSYAVRGANRRGAFWLGIWAVALLVAAQAAAAAMSTRLSSTPAPQAACDSALSPAAVSAIVGYKVPKPVGSAVNIPGSVTNHEISATGTSCEFSKGTSLTDLKTTIVITKEVTSTALTAQGIEAGLTSIKGSTITVTAYGGLNGPAFSYTQTLPGAITIYGMVALNGTTQTSAGVYTSTPQATLASLVRLGEKL